jgi:hypothetical protein
MHSHMYIVKVTGPSLPMKQETLQTPDSRRLIYGLIWSKYGVREGPVELKLLELHKLPDGCLVAFTTNHPLSGLEESTTNVRINDLEKLEVCVEDI